MEIIVNRKEFIEKLGVNKLAIDKKSTVNELSMVKIVADTRVTLTTNKLSCNIISVMNDANIRFTGEVLVDLDLIHKLCSKFNDDYIELIFQDNMLQIFNDKSSFNIHTADITMFPDNMLINDIKDKITLPLDELVAKLKTVLSCASNDDYKIILNSMFLNYQSKTNQLDFVTADGYQLVKDSISYKYDKDFKYVLSKEVISNIINISKLFKNSKIDIKLSEDHIAILFDNITIISKLINGTYPDYNQLMPKEMDVYMYINRLDLLGSLERISVLSEKNTHIIKLSIQNDNLMVECMTVDIGEGKDLVKINELINTYDRFMCCNSKMLIDILKIIDTETVELSFKGDTSPIKLKTDNVNFNYILMPIKNKNTNG